MIRFENHAFKGLDTSLKQLFDLQLLMGDAIREMMERMPSALHISNPDDFASAKAIDKRINEAELQAEKIVADIIGKFTTTGEDLRFIIGSIKITGTLERVADKAKNCIKRLGRISQPLPAEVKADLELAIEAVRAMIPLALGQVIDYKDQTTRELLNYGARVQHAYRNILLQLGNTRDGTVAADDTHVLLIAKNLEQAADMVIEIMKTSHRIHFGTKYEKDAAETA